MFLKNAISHQELRQGLGKEPMLDTEIEDTNLFKFEIPKIQAQGAVELQVAEIAAESRLKAKQISSKPAGGNSVANKNKPTNQSGTKAARTRPRNDRLDKFFVPEKHLKLDEFKEVSDYINRVFDGIAKQSTNYEAVSVPLQRVCEQAIAILSRSDSNSEKITVTRICSVLDSVRPVVEGIVAPYMNGQPSDSDSPLDSTVLTQP